MAGPVLLIRADASSQIGTGHVMRMIALAQAWKRRGGEVHLVSLELPPALEKRLAKESIPFHRVTDSPADDGTIVAGSDMDARTTTQWAARLNADWIIADGYRFDSEFQLAIGTAEWQLAIVTDYDYCEQWSCDLIMNQNPHAKGEPYVCAGLDTRKLLGTRHALLREEFLRPLADHSSEDSGSNRRVLVTLGGSDAENVTGEILAQINDCESAHFSIRVLIGGANPNRANLEALADQSRHDIEFLTSVDNMPTQYRWADGIVSAGGSSCWEWMYFGLPAAIVAIVDNQLPIYRELVANDVARGLGVSPEPINREVLATFLSSIERGGGEETRFRHLVDGFGADRVAAQLDTGLWLRSATMEDRQLYFDWANDPAVRQNSLQTDEIDWNAHCDWFGKQLIRSDCHLLILVNDEKPVAQIRFTKDSKNRWNIAFSVATEGRGTGLGGEILRLGIAWMNHRGHHAFTATVKADNPASARCFERLGWDRSSVDADGLVHFENV